MKLTVEETVSRALFDPGKIVPRIMDFTPPRWEGDSPEVEPLHKWQTRAVLSALGLDGLESAVKRANIDHPHTGLQIGENCARAVLKAALTREEADDV